jgi:GDPmannose 4,6-dehydratase
MKKALITGVTGQDGAYLAKLLLEEGCEVWGAYRRTASLNLWRLQELGIDKDIRLAPMDLLEYSNIQRSIEKIQPDEVYNLAAQSFVGLSFEMPIYTGDVDALGVARLLEAVRAVNPQIRYYQASTSEMFGKVHESPQRETTPFYPRSPYGAAKLYAHWMTVNYRESYGMHASSGILFNHESPFRGLEFVTRKITSSLARIKHGDDRPLLLGNLDARRDWGYAADYVRGMKAMLRAEEPGDYVLSTGQTHTVRTFVEAAARLAEMPLAWKGTGPEEQGIDTNTGKVIVAISPEFYRPAEVDLLLGDATKAKTELGWEPEVTFEGLAEMMMKADLDRASKGIIAN